MNWRCWLGLHPPRDTKTPRNQVWYVQQRSDAGYGPLFENCPLCFRWHKVSDKREILGSAVEGFDPYAVDVLHWNYCVNPKCFCRTQGMYCEGRKP